VQGSLVAASTGEYVLRLDNTFSMWTKKRVTFSAAVEPPPPDTDVAMIKEAEKAELAQLSVSELNMNDNNNNNDDDSGTTSDSKQESSTNGKKQKKSKKEKKEKVSTTVEV
jgi:hypothetical protein